MEGITYVLLVAIDNYNRVPKLGGCINDINKVQHYLEAAAKFNCRFTRLADAEATKCAISNAFSKIAEKITAQDKFLFYFTGHGAQETADESWKEPNGLLECIVCYDGKYQIAADFLLSGKELRYLLWKMSGKEPHIVTIFDCCHSGGNTRDIEFIQKFYGSDFPRERRVAIGFPQREWNEFIFYQDLQVTDTAPDILQGAHLQISACESNELAMEIFGSGVFTTAFVEILATSNGDISYFSLRSRIRQLLRFQYKQQPRIFTPLQGDEANSLMYCRFLDASPGVDESMLAAVVFNPRKGWVLHAGVIHGVKKGAQISVIDSESNAHTARAMNVFIDYSILEIDDVIDPDQLFNARVEGLQFIDLKLFVNIERVDPVKFLWLRNDLLQERFAGFILTEQQEDAEYALQFSADHVFLTKPDDASRPLFKPVRYDSNRTELLDGLRQVLRWNFIRLLQGSEADSAQPVKIVVHEVSADGLEKEIVIIDGKAEIGFYAMGAVYKNGLKIGLRNQSSQPLFIAALYLSFDFGSMVDILEGRVEMLEAGAATSLKLRSSRGAVTEIIPVSLPDVIHKYNWDGYTETLKLIISTEEFSPEALMINPLPSADATDTRYRSLEVGDDSPLTLSGWTTQSIALHFTNPLYQTNAYPQPGID